MSGEYGARADELLALAALGELTPEQAEKLDAAVAADPELAAELDADLALAARLQSTTTARPPDALRDRVLAAVAETPQDPPLLADERRRRRPRRRAWSTIAAAAAAAVLIVGGVVLLTGDDAGDDPIAAVVDAPDATVRSFSGELGTLRLVHSASERAFVIEGTGIPQPDPDRAYEAWLIDDDGARPLGVFRPDDAGRVSARFDDVDPSEVLVGITEEPASGSDTPTLPILATA